MKNLKALVIWCLLIGGTSVTAQSFFDVARVNIIRIPSSFEQPGESFTISELSGALNFGFKTVNEDRLLLSWNGEKRSINYSSEAPYQKPLFLNVFSTGYIKNWEDSPWRLLVLGRLKLGSDYDIWAAEDLSWGILAAATYTNSNDVSFTVGGHYGQELFGALIFPILGMDAALSDKTYFYAFFPAEVRLEHALVSKKLYANLVLNWMTNSYGLHNVPQNSFVQSQELMLRSYLDFNLSKNWVIFGAIGHTLINKYELKLDNGDLLLEPPFQSDFKNGWIFDVGMAFRIRFRN